MALYTDFLNETPVHGLDYNMEMKSILDIVIHYFDCYQSTLLSMKYCVLIPFKNVLNVLVSFDIAAYFISVELYECKFNFFKTMK